MKTNSTLVLLLCCFIAFVHSYTNPVPIFGIVTLPCESSLKSLGCKSSYINADYVKWLEAGGAKAVPIPYNATPEYITKLMGKINGVVFTGGNHDIGDRYLRRTYETVYNYAKNSYDSGIPMPIHGTCLGFEALALLEANYDRRIFSTYDSSYVSLPVTWDPENGKNAKFFDYLSEAGKKEIQDYLEKEKSTVNIHRWGVHPKTWANLPNVKATFNIVATSVDLKNKPFVTMFEGKKYPFFGTQYHPERVTGQMGENMLQTYENGRAMHHFGAMLVEKARGNMKERAFSSEKELLSNLVFNRAPIFMAAKIPGSDMQFYLY